MINYEWYHHSLSFMIPNHDWWQFMISGVSWLWSCCTWGRPAWLHHDWRTDMICPGRTWHREKHHGESWESSSWCSWKYQRDHQNWNWNNHWYSGTIYVVDETFKGKLDNRQMVSTHPINMGLYLTINDRLVSNSKWLKTIQVKISRIIDICHDIPWYT